MSTNASNNLFKILPVETLVNIFLFLNPQDLVAISNVDTHFHLISCSDGLWKIFSRRVGYLLAPITEENPARSQLLHHIVEIKQCIKCYKEKLPKDIAQIIISGIPSFEEFSILNNFLVARDTLVVWSELARLINESTPQLIFKRSNELLKKAEEFNPWFTLHQNELTQLKSFELNDNYLSTLPVEIEKLVKIKYLNLCNNSFSTLPVKIEKMTKLRHLDLYKNSLSTLSSEIGNLTELEHLSLDNNRLLTLPPEIGKLAKLRKLGLNKNSLSALPLAIGKLTRLQELYLSNNSLSTLLPEIGKLTELVHLELGNNSLSTLPIEIGNLTKLDFLDLRNNSFSTLPVQIGKLTNLFVPPL